MACVRCHIVLENGKQTDICCVQVGMVLVEITRHCIWIFEYLENVNGHSRVAGHYIVFESLKWTILNICLENVNGHSRVAGRYIILSHKLVGLYFEWRSM